MKKKLKTRYYIDILCIMGVILAGAIIANTDNELPVAFKSVTLLLLLTLVPFTVWNSKKKMTAIADEPDSDEKKLKIYKIQNMKMTLLSLPALLCGVVYIIEPSESTLYAVLAGLVCFIVFAIPSDEVSE